MVTVRVLIFVGVIAALGVGGCATARAKTQAEPPSLEVPAPPPRVIVPPEPEPAAATTPEPDPEPAQQKPARRPPQPRAESRPSPGAKEAKPPEPPPPVVEAVRPAEPAPTATLQQDLPATQTVERQVREQLAQAKKDLDGVDYKRLNAELRSQYDTAKRFIDQAEQALKEKNLVFAAKVAEKAAGLAASLPVR